MHQTIPSTEIYGPGSFVDREFLAIPDDARRILEILTRDTPGFTANPRFSGERFSTGLRSATIELYSAPRGWQSTDECSWHQQTQVKTKPGNAHGSAKDA